jgi:hypothetical protein
MEILDELDPGENKELKVTLHDIRTMATLGTYYAQKIEAATHLALFRETGEKVQQDQAVELLTQALATWKKYTELSYMQNHNPLWTNRVGYVDWEALTEWAEQDIHIARSALMK